MTEEAAFKYARPYGEHYDRLLGPNNELVWERPWQHNMILNNLGLVVAALLKDGSQQRPLAFWAIGSGDGKWDEGKLPIDAERVQRSTLYQEILALRQAILPETLNRINNRLECSMSFKTTATYSTREFGLLVRDPVDPTKFILINHQIHARIDMQSGFTLQRTLRLTF